MLFALALIQPAFADLDVAFLIDTTGSMSAELDEARQRVRQLSSAIHAARPNETLRIGVVAFRDRSDRYLTQVSPLSEDIATSERFLSGLDAQGGGDSPEDVLEGLSVAIHDLDWGEGEDTEHQLFLIGDAPPHLDYTDGPTTAQVIADARDRRIVIQSIGCRSLSGSGVRFFRDVAYQTEGRYQHIGRVSVDQDDLSDVMLQTLTGPIGPVSGAPLGLRERDETTSPSHPPRGVVARLGTWSDVDRREHEGLNEPICTLTVMTPDGLSLAAGPDASTTDAGLDLALTLTPGAGGASTWDLDRCLPLHTPIRMRFVEER